jgi:SagB-type dehydrogenase family enzyme
MSDDRMQELEANTEEANRITLNKRKDLKSTFGVYKEHLTDQMKGVTPPLLCKAVDKNNAIIKLPEPEKTTVLESHIFNCIESRKSRRKFSLKSLSLAELTYLLWATQGVRKTFNHNTHALRTVPSAGARHPFETYLAINSVDGLEPGLYRYLPFDNSLEFIGVKEDMKEKLIDGALDQAFAGQCAVSFIWTVIPYRTEWRYTVKSSKIILLDAGHMAQNLYMACESINCGTCAIGAYDQKKMDDLLGVDGEEEFTIYLSPVGKYS